jgi:hypothetical protein
MGEYMALKEQCVRKIPDRWTFADGAWVETFSIGYLGIWETAGPSTPPTRPSSWARGPSGYQQPWWPPPRGHGAAPIVGTGCRAAMETAIHQKSSALKVMLDFD